MNIGRSQSQLVRIVLSFKVVDGLTFVELMGYSSGKECYIPDVVLFLISAVAISPHGSVGLNHLRSSY